MDLKLSELFVCSSIGKHSLEWLPPCQACPRWRLSVVVELFSFRFSMYVRNSFGLCLYCSNNRFMALLQYSLFKAENIKLDLYLQA